MAERTWVVIDTITIRGYAEVKATSRADALRKARDGEVQFDYDDGLTFRRGDGLSARLSERD